MRFSLPSSYWGIPIPGNHHPIFSSWGVIHVVRYKAHALPCFLPCRNAFSNGLGEGTSRDFGLEGSIRASDLKETGSGSPRGVVGAGFVGPANRGGDF